MHTEHGFTLIELLISLAIVGILAAIAIPRYGSYRERAFDARASTDLRNVAIAEEAYFIDAEAYVSCADDSCTKLPGISKLSREVVLRIDATPTGFTGSSSHQRGSGRVFQWDSSAGGLIE